MIVKENLPVSQFSWLNSKIYKWGGVISVVYYPENTEELKSIVTDLQKQNKKFLVFGHTSNCYFRPSFSTDIIVSTLKLTRYQLKDGYIECEAGTHIKKVAKEMVQKGVEGYSGLVDLPGTVAAAVFGNAGCYGCDTAGVFHSADILLETGEVKTFTNADVHFSRRDSVFKKREVKGVILSVRLKCIPGDKDKIIREAEVAHVDRIRNQPGPSDNLGSSFRSGSKTVFYRILTRLAMMYKQLTKQNIPTHHIVLKWTGHKNLIPYLFEMNRFMFVDENAHVAFDEYVSLYKKLHKAANLEIEIYE